MKPPKKKEIPKETRYLNQRIVDYEYEEAYNQAIDNYRAYIKEAKIEDVIKYSSIRDPKMLAGFIRTLLLGEDNAEED